MSNISKVNPITLRQSQEGLIKLGELLKELSVPAEAPDISKIPERAISGNKINGGVISNFASIGIKDNSTRLVVLINDDGITTDTIEVETIHGNTSVTGDLDVHGVLRVNKLEVDEISADIRNSRTESLEFQGNSSTAFNTGLLWSGPETKQFILRASPDRFWSTESIDLLKGKAYFIGGTPVIDSTSLGSSVRESNLRSVGVLDNLIVSGDITMGDTVFFNSESDRFSIGTDSPNGKFSVAGWDGEFIVDTESGKVRMGNYSSSDLEIVTDNTPRITVSGTGKIDIGVKGSISSSVSIHGKLGVGVSQIPENANLAVAGNIKQNNKTFATGSSIPNSGFWRKGDIVWNDDAKPTGHVGWICIREGTPGEWRTFGNISA